MPKTLRLPDRIMQQIQIHCEAEGIAMALIGSDSAGVCMIMLGDQVKLSADQASIIGAHLLLEGVITGVFMQNNEQMLDEQGKPTPKENLN